MLNKNFKWQRTAIVLAMVSLCCFLFAGAALAAQPLVVSPDKVCAGSAQEFDLTVKDIDIDINCDLCGHDDSDNSIEVILPWDPNNECRQWTIEEMGPIPVDILVRDPDGNKKSVTSTVIPEILAPDSETGTVSAKLYVQCANLDVPVNSFAEKVTIRDFKAIAPDKSNDCYKFKVAFNGTDPKVVAEWCVAVFDSVREVVITEPVTDFRVDAGRSLTVKGYVTDLCGDLLPNVPVRVKLAGGEWVETYTNGSNPFKGEFTVSLTAPTCIVTECYQDKMAVTAEAGAFNGENGKVEVNGRTFCGTADDSVMIEVTGDVPVGVTWRDMPDENDDELGNDVRDEIYLNTTYPVKVTLRDGLCPDGHPDMICPGNPTVASEDVKVDLVALQDDENSVPQIAGNFYSDEAGNNQITYVVIPKGKCSVEVYFEPVRNGDINVEARAKYYDDSTQDKLADCLWTPFVISTDTAFELESTPLVFDNGCFEEQRAGWPFQVAVWVDQACEEFDVKVELTPYGAGCEAVGGTAMWSTELVKAYDVVGNDLNGVLKESGETYLHYATSEAQGLDHNYKSHFYVYTSPDVHCVDVRVKLTCKETGETWIEDLETIHLCTPVEMLRAITTETWQVLSTPKYIAKPGVAFNPANEASYGTFEDLLPAGSYSVIYTYDTYEPTKWVPVEPTQKVEPLKAYFIKTKQFDKGEKERFVEYIFARATTPDAMIPPVRSIDRSWNALGVAVQDNDDELLGLGLGDCDPFFLGDSPYRALGTVGKGSKLIYNPESMGNLVDGAWDTLTVSQDSLGSWVIDSTGGVLLDALMFYNGDGYWLYMTNKQELAANVGLEKFGNYDYTGN